MNNTLDEMLAVIQAYKDGKEIEFYSPIEQRWLDCPNPIWEFNEIRYRIKVEKNRPEPKFKIGDRCDVRVDKCGCCSNIKGIEYSTKDDCWYYSFDGLGGLYREDDIEKCKKSNYRPFKNIEEALEAIKKHGWYIKQPNIGYAITKITDVVVYYGNAGFASFSDLLNNHYTFIDGTPFGKLND